MSSTLKKKLAFDNSKKEKVNSKEKQEVKKHEAKEKTLIPRGKSESMKSLKYSSHSYYNSVWTEAQHHFSHILKEETEREPIEDEKRMFYTLCELYFKYLQLYKKLDEVDDQIVHPQKHLLIRKLFELIIIRLLEIRVALVNAENSEHFYFDELAYMGKIPITEFDVPIPKFYFHDPTPSVKMRDQWFQNISEKKARAEAERLEHERKLEAKLKEEEASAWEAICDEEDEEFGYNQEALIKMQLVERARQGKSRFLIAKYIYNEEKRTLSKKSKTKKPLMETHKAIVIIQKLVRGFLARRSVQRLRNEELELLGLRWAYPSDKTARGVARSQFKKNVKILEMAKERRREVRRLNQKMFVEAQGTILQKLRLLESPDMVEGCKSQIRNWILAVKNTTGKFPDIPKAEMGGSRLLIWPPDQLSDEGVVPKITKAVDSGKPTKKQDSGKKQKGESDGGKRKGGGVVETIQNKIPPPSLLTEMREVDEEYRRVWRGRDERHNPDQKYEEQFILDEKRALISEEVREQVDSALKVELQLMRQALEKKKGKKGKKAKKGKKGKGKGKKGKKGKKKKKGKDMTPDRTIESLFEELVEHGIIQSYPEVRLDSLVGSCSLINGEIRAFYETYPADMKSNVDRPMPADANPLPSYGDIKRAIKDLCILPLGSKFVNEVAPVTKSLIIAGPEGSGKKTLVDAVCTEVHATLFDLTAANIAGKYPGKPGLKMLMHLIEKVGRAIPPVAIKIDFCEKTYMKKVPKTDKTEPRRLKKQLGKFMKIMKPGDQFILIGLSSEPWISPWKVMKKDYQKVIYIPKPDFGTRMELWRHVLIPHAEFLHQDIHFSLLTKLSDGWTAGMIKKVVDCVVQNHKRILAKEESERRRQEAEPTFLMETGGRKISKVGRRMIRMENILQELSNFDPVFMEQDKIWMGWFNKTPLQKARLQSQVPDETGIPEKKKKGAKAKKGSKKGKKGKGKKK